MTINEDLGTIEYIFTDKTGTLTSNNMQFQKCTVQTMNFEMNDLINIFQNSYGVEKRFNNYYEQDQFKNIENLIEFFISILLNNEVLRDEISNDCCENY